MSTTHTKEGSEGSGTTRQESKSQRTSRRNTISEGPGSQTSENQETISNLGLPLPLLSNRRKGPLNVSEASIPDPKSSDISVQGQVFIPAHEHPSEKSADALHGHLEKTHGEAEKASEVSEPSPGQHQPRDSQNSSNPSTQTPLTQAAVPSNNSTDFKSTASTSRPSAHLFTQSESAVEVITESFAKFGTPQPRSVPLIRIHRPSGTVMAASVGTIVLNSENAPATPVPSALEQSSTATREVPLNTPTTTAAGIPTPVNQAGKLSAVIDAASATTSALPLQLPDLPVGGKVGKKKKAVRKARKLVLRKRVLAIIIGRELANVIHPQLDAVANLAGGIPLPVDGPSDLLGDYARRSERKRDDRRKELDQMIAAARIHSEAEAIHRCRICRGLTRTIYLRRYHRLKLKVEKPDMGTFERRATAMARVAAYKCKCTRRLLGVENELPANGSMATQHLRAPAAIEAPLPGVDGARQQ